MKNQSFGVFWWIRYFQFQLKFHVITAFADWIYDLKRYCKTESMKSENDNTTSTGECKAMTIKLRIREKRMEKGMSQMELAERLGVTQGAVMKWETGRCLPALDRAVEIAETFDCSVDDLICKEGR
ncbi:MAG: helix-turn-helix transcriptional regulator [Acidaminococcaceae bacterium]|nr:helix-turn-helix transcriptional regulator [Acidaminococcaceae bacterium]